MSYGMSMGASYFGRLATSEDENLVLSFLQDNTDQTRVHKVGLNGSVSGICRCGVVSRES